MSDTSTTSDDAPNQPSIGISSYFSNQGSPSSFDFFSPAAPPAIFDDVINPAPTATDSLPPTSDPLLPNDGDDDDASHAWIACSQTRQCLDDPSAPSLASAADYYRTPLTPRVLMVESLGDPVLDLLKRVSGSDATRETMKATDVEATETGLVRLIATENYRAAVDLTRMLLEARSARLDGKVHNDNEMGVVTALTPFTMRVWTTRWTLMTYKLRLYAAVEAEIGAFGDFDHPDLYYGYPLDVENRTRRGSIVPFSLRVLWAELPLVLGKPNETFDRLYRLLAVVDEMLEHLNNGNAPDGLTAASPEDIQRDVALWRRRRLTLHYSISNAAFFSKDVHFAVDVLDKVVEEVTESDRKCALLSTAGRMLLQFGDVSDAADYFSRAEALLPSPSTPETEAVKAANRGFLHVGGGQFEEAVKSFTEARRWMPDDPVLANNLACAMVYRGRLKEALAVLGIPDEEDSAIGDQDLGRRLHDGTIFNLATLFEFEPLLAMKRKKRLLGLISKHKGDGFNPQCLKIV